MALDNIHKMFHQWCAAHALCTHCSPSSAENWISTGKTKLTNTGSKDDWLFFDNHRMDCDRKKAGLPGSKLLKKTNHMLTAEDVPSIGGQWGRNKPQSLKRKLHKIWVKAVLWCERCDQVNCVFLTTMKKQLLEQLLPRHSFQKRCSLHSFFNIGKILNYPFLYRH